MKETPETDAANLCCRTYRIRSAQDDAIRAICRRTGDSMSSVMRRMLDLAFKEEARIQQLVKDRS
jgi:hypothetical protein